MPTNWKTKRYESPNYRAWIRTRRCLVLDCYKVSEPHHGITRGAGGDDKDCVPLCEGLDGHHAEIHRIGRWAFSERYRLDLKEAAVELWEEYIIQSEFANI